MAIKRDIALLFIISILGTILLLGILEASWEREALYNLRIEIYDISVSRIGLASADLLIKLRLTNPTSYDTPGFRTTLDIYLNGVYIGQLVVPETKISRYSTAFQDTTLTVTYSQAISALLRGSFSVTFHGRIYGKLLGIIPYEQSF